TGAGDELAKFLVAYLIYGPSTKTPADATTTTTQGGKTVTTINFTVAADMSGLDVDALNLSTAKAKTKMTSTYDLLSAYVEVPAPSTDPKGTKPTLYPSPLNSATGKQQLLAVLLDKT